ncbi:MAG: glycosyltransferase family 4 protein [Brevinematales bacterium]|nr:glycosyltransferase family 4 protein [Brevinematales bacterium]
MRISFLLPTFPMKPSGGFRVVYEYANHLVKKGHTVYVIHPYRLHPLPEKSLHPLHILKKIQRHILFRFPTPPQWQAIDPRVQMLYTPEPQAAYIPDADIIVATWWETAFLVHDYPLSKGQKFYLIQHYETWGGPKEKVDESWKLPLKKIVIAKWLYEKGMELHIPKEEIRHIPNAIDTKVFRLVTPIENRPPRIAMLSSPLEWKGAKDGIAALQKVKELHPNVQAVLFGVTPRPKDLPSWIEYFHNPPQKILVENIYNGSAIYLCPSWGEGWHLPPAEAMACGCTVVSTDIGGVKDYCIHEENALLSPVRNPHALAKNLCILLENKNYRLKLATAAHHFIQNFSWEKSTEKMIHWFEETLEESRAK